MISCSALDGEGTKTPNMLATVFWDVAPLRMWPKGNENQTQQRYYSFRVWLELPTVFVSKCGMDVLPTVDLCRTVAWGQDHLGSSPSTSKERQGSQLEVMCTWLEIRFLHCQLEPQHCIIELNRVRACNINNHHFIESPRRTQVKTWFEIWKVGSHHYAGEPHWSHVGIASVLTVWQSVLAVLLALYIKATLWVWLDGGCHGLWPPHEHSHTCLGETSCCIL